MSDKQTDIEEILNPKMEVTDRPPDKAESDTVKDSASGPPRDEKGKFAAKQTPAAPAPVKPETTGDKTTIAPAGPPPATPLQPPHGFVPTAALIDQRLEARQAKQRVADLERRLAEATKPKAEPVDFYADPDAAFNQRFQAALTPMQRQLLETRTALFEERLYRIAGGEKAAAIEAEIQKAMDAGDPDVHMLADALNTRGVAAVNALVDWYDRRTFDPTAKEAEIEAKILAKYGIDPAAPPFAVKPPPVMPSNIAQARNVGSRSGPAWAGPTPLADIFKR